MLKIAAITGRKRSCFDAIKYTLKLLVPPFKECTKPWLQFLLTEEGLPFRIKQSAVTMWTARKGIVNLEVPTLIDWCTKQPNAKDPWTYMPPYGPGIFPSRDYAVQVISALEPVRLIEYEKRQVLARANFQKQAPARKVKVTDDVKQLLLGSLEVTRGKPIYSTGIFDLPTEKKRQARTLEPEARTQHDGSKKAKKLRLLDMIQQPYKDAYARKRKKYEIAEGEDVPMGVGGGS